jgi:hypothetical protein
VYCRKTTGQKPMTDPGIGPAISTAHGCRDRQCEACQRGQDFGVWLGLIRSTVFDGWFVSDATTLTQR